MKTPILAIVGALAVVLGLTGRAAADTAFARHLIDIPNATFEDGVKAIYLLDTGADKLPDFNACLVHLLKKKLVSLDWDLSPEQRLTNGRLSWMFVKALDLKGGATLRLLTPIFGLTERYAYRECAYLEFIGDDGQNEYVSGERLLTALRKTRSYKKTGKVD